MSLSSAIEKLQNSGARLYSELAQYFIENGLIREIWLEMAHAKEQQVASLKSLPPRFWVALKNRQEHLAESVQSCLRPGPCSSTQECTLHKCLERSLEFEGPILQKVYAPLIRQLRTEWTDHALDFYIMIKAHVARLVRVVESFSGDPVLIKNANTLLQDFERDVQTPEVPPVVASQKARRATTPVRPKTAVRRKAAKRVVPARTAVSSRRRLGKRTKVIPARAKPLVKNIELRRRARGR